MKPASRKFQPSVPNRKAHIGISRFGAWTEIAAAEPAIAVMIMTGIAIRDEPGAGGAGWGADVGAAVRARAADRHHRAHRVEGPGQADRQDEDAEHQERRGAQRPARDVTGRSTLMAALWQSHRYFCHDRRTSAGRVARARTAPRGRLVPPDLGVAAAVTCPTAGSARPRR